MVAKSILILNIQLKEINILFGDFNHIESKIIIYLHSTSEYLICFVSYPKSIYFQFSFNAKSNFSCSCLNFSLHDLCIINVLLIIPRPKPQKQNPTNQIYTFKYNNSVYVCVLKDDISI